MPAFDSKADLRRRCKYGPNDEHILLRINKTERRAVGLTIFEYSLLAQQTEMGPRGFPLTGLNQLPDELRDMVLEILQQPPVSEIVSLLAYTPSPMEMIPVTMLQPLPAISAQEPIGG